MDAQLIDKLKVACNQFYLGKYLDQPTISDKEFDQLRKDYESETGRSVKELVEWEGKLSKVNLPEEPLDKVIAEDNNLTANVQIQLGELGTSEGYITPKYDGCGIKAIYENGVLKCIQSTPDEEYGIVRTKAFWNLFPHQLKDTSIIALRGEVLVDAEQYGELARNKANGLTNSIYQDEEVEQECFVRIYKVQFKDSDNWSTDEQFRKQFDALDSLHHIRLTRVRNGVERDDLVFASTMMYQTGFEFPNSAIWQERDFKAQVDGVVLYTPQGPLGIKYYYTEYADTTVTEVQWNRQFNGSFAAVLIIDEVELNGKCIGKVSAGGVPHLMDWKMGVGAEVRVILANMTIPKIIQVNKPSEDYQFPICECGYQLSAADIFGSNLKCQEVSKPCEGKLSRWLPNMISEILSDEGRCEIFEDYFNFNWSWFLNYLSIDRWNPESKINVSELDKDCIVTKLNNAIFSNDKDEFLNVMGTYFNWTDLSWANFEINYITTFECYQIIRNNWSNLQSYYDEHYPQD